ncbi:MAG: hypothetical protein NC301_09240 [Bacteroides sp.]|nr:hypothetical protein [Bacteroides sp.]
MNKAEYLSTLVKDGGNGLYPLSTQGLNFIQDQIAALQALAYIGGKRYILRSPHADPTTGKITDGLVVIDGELLPLRITSSLAKFSGIQVVEEKEDVVADGTTYKEARTYRYARCVSFYSKDVPNLYPASGFANLQSNDALTKKLQEYVAINSELAKKLTVFSYSNLTRTQLDGMVENARINCRKGCIELNGATEYTINVYRHSADNITQEQVLPDMQRYVRHWDSAKKAWGAFFPMTDNLHIDVKVVNGTTVYVRHGFIPDGVQLVLLRKKKRSKKRRSGGAGVKNAQFRGKVVRRLAKNQYVHYKGVILSTSKPNTWYVPKCIGVGDIKDNVLIGKELATVCKDLIVERSNASNQFKDGTFNVVGTKVKASSGGHKAGTQAICYARIALQFAQAGRTYKGAGGEMVQMKYRLWFDTRKSIVRRGFSVI